MKIKELIQKNNFELVSGTDTADVNDIVIDSRVAKSGDMFVAIKGAYTDGHNYIEQVLERGVTVIAITNSNMKINAPGITILLMKEGIDAIVKLADDFYGQPNCKLVGVTGTNGKTTTSYIVRDMIEKNGIKAGLISTIAYEYEQRSIPADRTTPDIFTLYSLLHKMDNCNVEVVVMEVSSHAICQKRIGNLKYDIAIFTNLTQDHLDYHQNMEQYYEAKKKLFYTLKPDGLAIINIGSDYGKLLADELNGHCRLLTYGIDTPAADYFCYEYCTDIHGSSFSVKMKNDINRSAKIPLLGKHNIENCMAGFIACVQLNVTNDSLVKNCGELKNVPGRLEFIKMENKPLIIIDYAHTEDAIQNVLNCLRNISSGELWIVFGCGGDRDKGKRAKMGAVAEKLADKVIITTDNPRTEIPNEIIKDILTGMNKNNHLVIEDRKAAIKYACENADSKTVVLIAGKGHELYQEINRIIYEFNEREIVQGFLSNIK